jgi:hypothetical protein
MSGNKPSLYLINVLVVMLILPVVSIAVECLIHSSIFGWVLIGKWFVFWAIGVRLFTAGIRQVAKPAFTAQEIFHINNEESFVIVKELGFANICIGLVGILSLHNIEWCHLAAIGGGLYFGLAGLQHVIKKPASTNETIALISDVLLFGLMALYLVFTSFL